MTTTETCPHWWLIETAQGPTSVGVCQLCQETREFKNSILGKDYSGFRRFELGQLKRGGPSKSVTWGD